jgi:hypothetical protein
VGTARLPAQLRADNGLIHGDFLLAYAAEPGGFENRQGHADDVLFAQIEGRDKGVVEQRQINAKRALPIVSAAALRNYGHRCARYPVSVDGW